MFKTIDLFGQSVLFKFNGKTKSKSSIGGWFSLVLFGFVIWAIFNTGQDIIYRQNPKTIMSETFDEDPKPMVLAADTFNFAVGLQLPVTHAHYINESIYTLEIHLNRQKREINRTGQLEIKTESISLKVERCTKEHFGVHGFKFENLELNELYCLSKNQQAIDKISLQGTFESSFFEDLEIIVRQCDPKTSRTACASDEIINELLESCWFAIYYTNLAIDTKNSTNPSFIFRDSYYTAASNSFFKDIPLWLNHLTVNSDFGWLIEQKELQNFVKVGYIRESSAFLQKDLKRMIYLRIRMDKITINYERSYLKIGDVIASANGFATTGILIMFLILGPYSKIKFYERLINELFDLNMLRKDHNNKDKKKKPYKKSKTFSSFFQSKKSDVISQRGKDEGNINVKSNESSGLSPVNNIDSFSRSPFSFDEKGNDKVAKKLNCVISTQFNTDQPKSFAHNLIDISQVKSFEEIPETNKYLGVAISSQKMIQIQNNQEKNYQEQEKNLSELISTNMPPSPQIRFSSPRLLQHKPEMSIVRPKIKILDNYEPLDPEESLAVLESLILDGQNQAKANQIPEETVVFKPNKIEKAIDQLEPKKKDTIGEIKFFEQSNLKVDEETLNKKTEYLSFHLTQDPDKLHLSFGEYIQSYFWKSQALREKFGVLEEGIRRIEERLDIFNVLKKFREVDKLKLLLLENEQLVLFDTLPKPEIFSKTNMRPRHHARSFSQFKETRFVSEKRKKDLILLSYKNLKKKSERTVIDMKLLEIYDDLINS